MFCSVNVSARCTAPCPLHQGGEFKDKWLSQSWVQPVDIIPTCWEPKLSCLHFLQRHLQGRHYQYTQSTLAGIPESTYYPWEWFPSVMWNQHVGQHNRQIWQCHNIIETYFQLDRLHAWTYHVLFCWLCNMLQIKQKIYEITNTWCDISCYCFVFTILHCHITFNFNHIFCKNYALGKILSREIFISMFIKESHSGVHRYEYPYHAVTSH
jgi:hypothetical protein